MAENFDVKVRAGPTRATPNRGADQHSVTQDADFFDPLLLCLDLALKDQATPSAGSMRDGIDLARPLNE
jgi:hypothetical protein